MHCCVLYLVLSAKFLGLRIVCAVCCTGYVYTFPRVEWLGRCLDHVANSSAKFVYRLTYTPTVCFPSVPLFIYLRVYACVQETRLLTLSLKQLNNVELRYYERTYSDCTWQCRAFILPDKLSVVTFCRRVCHIIVSTWSDRSHGRRNSEERRQTAVDT